MISFSNVDINCENDDKLLLFNEDKSSIMYDYCLLAKNKTMQQNFFMAKAKYLIARLQTTSNRFLSATFDLVLLDSPSLITIQQPPPLFALTTPLNQIDSVKEQEVPIEGKMIKNV